MAMRNDTLVETTLRMRDFDKWYGMRAYVDEDYADSLHDLLYLTGDQFKYNSNTTMHSAYVISPQGVTETFGVLDTETVAWVIQDEGGPALVIREKDNGLDDYIERWMNFWLDNPAPTLWPIATPETAALWVPVDMRNLTAKGKRRVRRNFGR